MGQKKTLGDLCKGQCGIGDDDVGISNLSKAPVGEERSGNGGPASLKHPIPGDEGQIVWACLLKTG